MGTRVILTYRDYEALPADGRRYELHEGELSVTPAPGTDRGERGALPPFPDLTIVATSVWR